MEKNKYKKGQLRHRRFVVSRCTFAAQSIFGVVIEINLSGLSFRSISSKRLQASFENQHYMEESLNNNDFSDEIFSGSHNWISDSQINGFLLSNTGFRIENLPVTFVSSCLLQSGVFDIWRYGIKFGDLSHKQISLIEYFIQTHTTESVSLPSQFRSIN